MAMMSMEKRRKVRLEIRCSGFNTSLCFETANGIVCVTIKSYFSKSEIKPETETFAEH